MIGYQFEEWGRSHEQQKRSETELKNFYPNKQSKRNVKLSYKKKTESYSRYKAKISFKRAVLWYDKRDRIQNPMRNLEFISKIQTYTHQKKKKKFRKKDGKQIYKTLTVQYQQHSNVPSFWLGSRWTPCSNLVWKPKAVEIIPSLGRETERNRIHPWTARWSEGRDLVYAGYDN